MKKEILLILLLLSGCGNIVSTQPKNSSHSLSTNNNISSTSIESTSSNIVNSSFDSSEETFNFENDFNELKKGIKVKVVVEEKTTSGNTNYYYLENSSKNNEFSSIMYKSQEFNSEKSNIYYTKLANDDNVYCIRLGIDNEYVYYPLYNGYIGELFSWNNDGFRNVFDFISSSMFIKNDNKFTLKSNALSNKNIQASLSTLLYGNVGLEIDNFEIYYENNNLKIASSGFYSSYYTYTFSATVEELGNNFEIKKNIYPYEEKSDENFTKMIDELKENNYTATIKEYEENTLVKTSLYQCTKEGIYVEVDEYKYGFYSVDENHIQEIVKKGDIFKKEGLPEEEKLEIFQPKFNMSFSCFEKKEDKYHLLNNVDADIYTYTIVGIYATTLDDFTIEIIEDGYLFTNIGEDEKIEVEFKNIGNTSLPYEIN